MSKIKKSIIYYLSVLLAFSFLVTSLPKPKTVHAAETNEIMVVDDQVLNYVSISTADLPLTADKLKTIDTDNDGKLDTSFIIANGTISLNFHPFEFNYTTIFDENLYYKTTITKTIEKLADGEFPATFTLDDGSVVNYQVSASNTFSFKHQDHPNSVSNEFSDLIEVTTTETTRTFTFIKAYTLKAESPNTTFTFSAGNLGAQLSTTQYTLNFERPLVDFKTDYVTHFTCKQLDGNSVFDNEIIERELSFENVKLQFTNNSYTKNNPLYFDINYNGFIYTFTLYSENDLLFVEYYDEQRPQNNRSLATSYNENGDNTEISKYITGSSTDYNMFSIDFNQTGRYEISVYDSTYLLLKKQPYIVIPEDEDPTDDIEPEPEIVVPEDNKFNYNFFQTSFYIKTSDLDSDSAFENAYVIMQSYDDDGNYQDYIVKTSTQNNNVQVTLKNLDYYIENDTAIANFTASETLPDLNIVQFIKTTLSGSTNIPQSTFYTLSELKELLKNKKDINIQCTEDAFYEILIYQYDSVTYNVINKKQYEFTIVKQPKTSFTVFEVDEYNDPIEIPGSNPVQYKKVIREADTPYETIEASYKININSSMEISTLFCEKLVRDYPVDGLPALTPTTLPKTYLNEYKIDFAMQEVSIEQLEDKENKSLILKFMGIGEIKVNVTVNSVTSTYTIQSGESLNFVEYGIYSIQIEDSMGTIGTATFNYKKPVSMSAVIMLVLIGIIVLAIVLLVLSSRGKLKTR